MVIPTIASRVHTEQFKPAIETIIAAHPQFHGQLEVAGLKLEQNRASEAILVIYTFVRPFPFSFGLLLMEGGSRCSTKGVSDAFPIVSPKNGPEFCLHLGFALWTALLLVLVFGFMVLV
ncbi:hypothetical protein TNCT_358781 [Trichonephila clavata]|uniref:Uncharacterized protein n=1 Tax=Trichonephila clavata TaxID=2740835 RepID=A0A8X6I1W5_TRICU|nr:hypothetical protein TNCT_358781 [Trichonephila clavata]